MTFIEKYSKIMGENARRQHAIQQHVVKTYDELLNSVGAYTDGKLAADSIPLNALLSRPKGGNEGEALPVKDGEEKAPKGKMVLDIETPKTKLDAVAKQIHDEFKKDGINKVYKQNLADGVDDKKFDTFIAIVDELKLWKEYPPTS